MPSQPTPLTLIVATTTSPSSGTRLGIGLNGTLPWSRIKTDMSFFARVTARPPALSSSPSQPGHGPGIQTRTNAVIMGRKTYDSVPLKLRPLGKRLNVVVSRDEGGKVSERVREELEGKLGREREVRERKAKEEAEKAGQEGSTGLNGAGASASASAQTEGTTDAFVASSLEGALCSLDKGSEEGKVGHFYVIGGAEIYASALKLQSQGSGSEARHVRIIMTEVEKLNGEGFECDTFFPIDGSELAGQNWRKVSPEEVTGWVGEDVSGEWIEEGDVRVRMVGYERVNL
ncbi:dihydrofolate reductase-like domain-containing protein [Aspergillus unguis]